MSEGTGSGHRIRTAGMLLPPYLPDAEQIDVGAYRIDLQSPAVTSKAAVEVMIPPYVERNLGDRIIVSLVPSAGGGNGNEVTRYFYLSDLSHEPPEHISIRPLQLLVDGYYQASYTVASRSGNVSCSGSVEVEVINSPMTSVGTQVTLFGSYQSGLVAAWVVAESYSVAPADVLYAPVESKQSDAGVTLGVYRPQDIQPVLSIYTIDGRNWSCKGDQLAQFEKGNLVSLKLEGSKDSGIYLAMVV